MKANMHIHSKFSDGTQWPKEIVKRAKSLKLKLIALTDHDTIAGNPEFLEACEKYFIKGISGVEIDCVGDFDVEMEQQKTIHIHYDSEVLGYFPNQKYENVSKLLEPVHNIRKQKMRHFINRSSEIFNNPEINWNDFYQFRTDSFDIEKQTLNFTLMKPHLFSYLKNKAISKLDGMDFQAFKNAYFQGNNETSLERNLNVTELNKLRFDDVIKAIRNDKGYAVIPHLALRFIPKEIKEELKNNSLKIFRKMLNQYKEQYIAFLQDCKDLSVWGIEMYYYKDYESSPKKIKELNNFVRNLANKEFNFTWGSDCHGLGSSSDTLGRFSGKFRSFV